MPNTYTPIVSQTLSSATNSITFSSIPSTYTDLILICSCASSLGSGSPSLGVQFNNDTSTNYSLSQLVGTGSAASSNRSTSATEGQLGNMPTASGAFSSIIAHFMGYSNNTTNKTVLARSSDADNYVILRANLWRNTSAITTIRLFEGSASNLVVGSTFTLYGIKAAQA